MGQGAPLTYRILKYHLCFFRLASILLTESSVQESSYKIRQ